MMHLKNYFALLICIICVFIASCNLKPEPVTEKTLDRHTYRMKYYSNWKIDSSDTETDLDSYFVLNPASGNGSASFFIYNSEIDEQLYADAQIKAHLEKIIVDGTVTKFESWGKYKGQGAIINGKYLGLLKGEIKIFVHSGARSSFLIVSQLFDDDKEKDLPGLQLIESTFRLK